MVAWGHPPAIIQVSHSQTSELLNDPYKDSRGMIQKLRCLVFRVARECKSHAMQCQ